MFSTIFLLVLFSVNVWSDEKVNVIVKYPEEYVKLGEKVEITCNSSLGSNDLKISLGRKTMLENCDLYDNKTFYSFECTKEKVKFVIKHVRLEDIDIWSCSRLSGYKEFKLNGYDGGKMKLSLIGHQTPIQSNVLGPELMPKSDKYFVVLKGRGIKTNPFDLRNDVSIDVKCVSTCIYPRLNHSLELINNLKNISIITSFPENIIQSCQSKKYTITNKISFKCANYKLKGVVKLSCYSYKPESNIIVGQQHTFILCPTEPIKWWLITLGEKVLTGIGCIIGFMLFLLLILLISRWKSNKYKDLDDCHKLDSHGNQALQGYRV